MTCFQLPADTCPAAIGMTCHKLHPGLLQCTAVLLYNEEAAIPSLSFHEELCGCAQPAS